MKAKKYSLAYTILIEMLLRAGQQADARPVYGSQVEGDGSVRFIKSNVTAMRDNVPINITNSHLYSICTSAEWDLVGKITTDLKYNCALWHCDPELKRNNSSIRRAIKGLIGKGILIGTETTDIYIINPHQVRSGELFAVITTTASALAQEPKVDIEHIRRRRTVKEFLIDSAQVVDLRNTEATSDSVDYE